MTLALRLTAALREETLVLPEAGAVLVMRGRAGEIGDAVPHERLIVEQPFRPDYDALAAAGLRVVRHAEGPAAMVVVVAGRSRPRSLGDVARGLRLLAPGAVLALDGAKTDGIEALARQIAAEMPLAGHVAKAHGRLVWLHRPDSLPPAVADWEAAAQPRRNGAGFLAAPGMFSPEGADPGSERLAAHLDGRLRGRVAELGAGWGWLAAEALARCPDVTAIDLFEADAEALDAARTNVGDPRAAFHWRDVCGLTVADGPFDAVISNPPFHQGRAADPALGAAFIAAAARILKRDGTLLLVANRQLPYEAPLAAAFQTVETLDQDRHYKVLQAGRPRAGTLRPAKASAARSRAGRGG
jgi:16S rRNA (guanine1207-N2)-methyltransferase